MLKSVSAKKNPRKQTSISSVCNPGTISKVKVFNPIAINCCRFFLLPSSPLNWVYSITGYYTVHARLLVCDRTSAYFACLPVSLCTRDTQCFWCWCPLCTHRVLRTRCTPEVSSGRSVFGHSCIVLFCPSRYQVRADHHHGAGSAHRKLRRAVPVRTWGRNCKRMIELVHLLSRRKLFSSMVSHRVMKRNIHKTRHCTPYFCSTRDYVAILRGSQPTFIMVFRIFYFNSISAILFNRLAFELGCLDSCPDSDQIAKELVNLEIEEHSLLLDLIVTALTKPYISYHRIKLRL